MPRYEQTPFNERQQVESQEANQVIRPIASPVDTQVHYSFNHSEANGLLQLAQGLASFGQGFEAAGNALTHFAQFSQVKQTKEDVLQGENYANQLVSEGKTLAEVYSAISPDASEAYQQSAKLAAGRAFAATDGQLALQAKHDPQVADALGLGPYEVDKDSPEYAQQWFRKFTAKRLEGVSDPYILNSYTQGMVPVGQHMISQATRDAIQASEEGRLAGFNKDVQNQLGLLREKAPGHDFDFVTNQLFPVYGKFWSKGDIEDKVASQVYQLAIDPMRPDPSLLDVLRRPGKDNGKEFPSYADRHPEDFQKMYNHAIKVFAATRKDTVDIYKEQKLDEWNRYKETVKGDIHYGMDQFDSLIEAVRGKVYDMFGKSAPEKMATLRKDFREILANHDHIRNVAELAYTQGTPMDLPENDRKLAWSYLVDRELHRNPNTQGNPDEALFSVARKLNTVAPEHVSALVGAYSKVNMTQGDITAPEHPMKSAWIVANRYKTLDGGKGELLLREVSKVNPQAGAFYENVFQQMGVLPSGDVQSAVYNAYSTMSDPSKRPKANPKVINELIESTLAAIPEFGELSVEQQKDPFIRNYLDKTINSYLSSTGNLPSIGETLQSVKSRFEVIGGKWIDTNGMGNKFTEEEKKILVPGIINLGIIKAHEQGMFDRLGVDLSKINLNEPTKEDFSHFSLHPVSRQQGIDGKPLYMLTINNNPLGVIDLRAALDQYRNPGKQTPEFAIQTVETINKVRNIDRNKLELSPEEADDTLDTLYTAKKSAVMRPKVADDLIEKVKQAKARFGTRDLKETLAQQAAYLDAHTVLKNLKSEAPDELLVKAKPLTGPEHYYQDKEVISDLLEEGTDYDKALAIAVFGSKLTNPSSKLSESDPYVGYGYSLSQDPKALKEDFSKSKLNQSFTKAGGRGVLMQSGDEAIQGLLNGKNRLNRESMDKLFTLQNQRAEKMVKQVFGEDEYTHAPTSMRSAMKVLSMATGNNPDKLDKIQEAIEDNEWDKIKDYMTVVPKEQRDSALAYIRAMSHGLFTFKYLIDR
jgi:hypothetical protein